jgi:hypothetical protein
MQTNEAILIVLIVVLIVVVACQSRLKKHSKHKCSSVKQQPPLVKQQQMTPEDYDEYQRTMDTTQNFDADKGYYPGDDLMQYHTDTDYAEHLADVALDENTRSNHEQWLSEVLPWSQTALKVDDMDEAVYMNTRQGHGITTYRQDLPTQGPNTLFITEGDAELHSRYSKSFNFNG